jgi:hypothetical protein
VGQKSLEQPIVNQTQTNAIPGFKGVAHTLRSTSTTIEVSLCIKAT